MRRRYRPCSQCGAETLVEETDDLGWLCPECALAWDAGEP